jgi:hypothetical protein
MSISDKPRLAGRQPSFRGGVPRVMTWLTSLDEGKRGRHSSTRQLAGMPAMGTAVPCP